jgi:hypothetical protein
MRQSTHLRTTHQSMRLMWTCLMTYQPTSWACRRNRHSPPGQPEAPVEGLVPAWDDASDPLPSPRSRSIIPIFEIQRAPGSEYRRMWLAVKTCSKTTPGPTDRRKLWVPLGLHPERERTFRRWCGRPRNCGRTGVGVVRQHPCRVMAGVSTVLSCCRRADQLMSLRANHLPTQRRPPRQTANPWRSFRRGRARL